MSIPNAVDTVSVFIAKKTEYFVETRLGKIFLSVVLDGPFTFLPTIYAAWTEPNIDSLRTLTWPLMIIVNMSATLSVAHKGNWQIRLVMVLWILAVTLVYVATLVR